jgi:O-antigen/teichoic acid export membrane protein
LRAHFAVPLFRNAYLLTMSSGLMALLGLPFWAIAAKRYSAETVGLSSTIVSAMMLISGIAQLGLSGILVRYLPGAATRTRRLIGLSYTATIAVSVLAGAMAALTAHAWSPSLNFLALRLPWFVLFVAAVVVWTVFSLQDSVLVGLRQTHWIPLENAVFAIAKLVLVGAFAVSYPRAGVVLAWIMPGMILIIPVNIAIFARFVPMHLAHSSGAPRWRITDLRRLVFGNYVGNLLAALSSFVIPILVLDELGAARTAYFFVPWTITLGVCLVAANLMTSMVMEVAFVESTLREQTRRVLRAILRSVVPAALCLALLAPYVLRLLGNDYAKHGTLVLRILLIGTIPNAVAAVGLNVARLRHDGRFIALVQGTVAVIFIGVAAVLIPHIGIEGAGVAWLASQVLAAMMATRPLRATTVPESSSVSAHVS